MQEYVIEKGDEIESLYTAVKSKRTAWFRLQKILLFIYK